jgi:6-pyruvoyltetrahydropterin/6-carboxytetrahydropterin synthase
MYTVELYQSFNVRQGLKSPVRGLGGLPPLISEDGFDVTLRIGIKFSDSQLTDKGWFVDTDAVEKELEKCAQYLSSNTWTQLFEFRPTFELVARWVYNNIIKSYPQLAYVELENTTIAVRTRYQG